MSMYSLSDFTMLASEGYHGDLEELCKENGVEVCFRCNGKGTLTYEANSEAEWDEDYGDVVVSNNDSTVIYSECPNCNGDGYVKS